MTQRRRITGDLLLAGGLLLGAVAAGAQDVDRGRELAEANCMRCHTVKPGGDFKEYPPSFAAIGVYRAEEQIRNRISFPPYHTGMPRFLEWKLDREDIDDLVAYIQSLEPPKE